MDAETLRKKPGCVLRRDAWLTELRQLEDRESLRPWLHKYGCFEKKNSWSSSGMVHLENLKELAKRFRLHKSIPNFFRDYTTEDSLVAVLKRYVRNNAAFLSVAPSVARARRAAHPQADTGGGGAGGSSVAGGTDPPLAAGQISSVDSSSLLDGTGTVASNGVHVAARDDASGASVADICTATAGGDGPQHAQHRPAGATIPNASEVACVNGTGGGLADQAARGSGILGSHINITTHSTTGGGGGRGGRTSTGAPRRPLQQARRPNKASILLHPSVGGRKLFGHSDADTTSGMIQMSRMGLSSRSVGRLDIIYRQNQRSQPSAGSGQRNTGEGSQRGVGERMNNVSGPGGVAGGDERTGPAVLVAGARQGVHTAPGGGGVISTTKQRNNVGGQAVQRNNENGDGGGASEEGRGGVGWRDGAEGGGQRVTEGGFGNEDYSQTLKIKAAQALFRMSLESGGEMKMVRDGVVVALMKLISVENVQAHRLVSGCLANLTTTRDVTSELLEANGHQVLAFLVNGVKTPDSTTLANVATALCRCTYESRNHRRLVTEYNTAQALCYIMQRQNISLKIASARAMLNICGLSSTMPALAAKLDVYMLTLCSAMEDLARNEKEGVQAFVCRGIQGLTSVPECLSRIPESGIVDLLLPLVKLNQKRPGNLARLASASVNLAAVQSAHAQLVKQKDMVAVLCLLAGHPRLVESCCVASACLSRTRDLETHLAPLAMTLVDIHLPNEASVDCIAFFLQNVSRAHPVSEPSVTSWLAVGADSASADGRLACLSAIGHLIRQQEGADTPLLQAGLMSTLHAIVDEPSSSSADELTDPLLAAAFIAAASSTTTDATTDAPPIEDANLPTTSRVQRSNINSGGKDTPTPEGLRGGAANSGKSGNSGGGIGAGGASDVRKLLAATHLRKKHREELVRSGPDTLDRILGVVTKICFSLTLRALNRPQLVKYNLPALCAKIVKLTEDANIQFMAVACVFSLTQSPELCPDIAKTAATELALNALAQGRPGEESEVLLVHLAVVAQMTEGPRFCRRLASPTTIDLLMRLALVTPPREKAEISSSARFDETKEGWTEEKRSDGNGGDNRTTCDAGGDGVRGVGDKFNSTQSDTTKKTSIAGNGGLEDRNIDADSGGGELASAKRGSGVVEDGGRCSSDKNEKRRVNRQPLPCIKRFSGSSVKVASPYMGALRYCVVTIAEHIGEIFDREHGSGESSAEGGGGAGNGSTSSLSDVTQMVEQLVRIVCSVVRSSGPDEALMGRCALVMADWSTRPRFAKEMGIRRAAGSALAILVRSVAPATTIRASIALCNIAAASHTETVRESQNNGYPEPDSIAAPVETAMSAATAMATRDEKRTVEGVMEGEQDDTRADGGGGGGGGDAFYGADCERDAKIKDKVNSAAGRIGDTLASAAIAAAARAMESGDSRASFVIGSGENHEYWLRSTDNLREIVAGALVRSTREMKGNIIKAINNLMCSEETRVALVKGNQMPHLFQLVHGYTPEVRELVAGMLYNLTCEREFHPFLLDADITYSLLELLGPSGRGASRAPRGGARNAPPSPTASTPVTTGGGESNGGGPDPGGGLKSAVRGRGGNTVSVGGGIGSVAVDGGMGSSSGGMTGSLVEAPYFSSAARVGSEDALDTSVNDMASNVVVGGGDGDDDDDDDDDSDADDGSAFDTRASLDDAKGLSAVDAVAAAVGVGSGGVASGGGGSGNGGGGGTGDRPNLLVRRYVLGAVMNLTSSSLSHTSLEPSAVMSLLTLIMQEDSTESPNEDMAGELWVAWQAVVLQLSFVERYRSLIVYHSDGQVFQHVKLTNDPLSSKSSVMSPAHDRAYKRLIMGTMVNIACEPSLYEELEGQVQVLREFLSDYEHEASGGGAGCTTGGSRGSGTGRADASSRGSGASGAGSNGGSRGGSGLGDRDDHVICTDDVDRERDTVRGTGGGRGVRGASRSGGSDNPSRGRDWIRHELCGKLVSNLFSSKSLRERLSKKPIAGILVGLLCGPPARANHRAPNVAPSKFASSSVLTSRPSRSAESGTGTNKGTLHSSSSSDRTSTINNANNRSHRSRGGRDNMHKSRDDHGRDEAREMNDLLPEGYGEPRPVLYGGGDEAAGIASRFLCEMSVLYAAEGGFELPQRTFEALVKIAHYYNHNAFAPSQTTSNTTKGGTSCTGVDELPCPLAEGVGGGGANSCVRDGKSDDNSVSLREHPSGKAARSASGSAQLSSLARGIHSETAAVMVEADVGVDEKPESGERMCGNRNSHGGDAAIHYGDTDRDTGYQDQVSDVLATSPIAVPPSLGLGGGDNNASGQQQVPTTVASRRRQEGGNCVAGGSDGGDDWYETGRLSMRNRQGGPWADGRVGEAWLSKSRELTRLWVRAVGSLCSPSQSGFWPLMIEAGILGALNTCVCSAALTGDAEGLGICSVALRNLSTATPPRSLGSERAAACFGCARRLLDCCPEQATVRVNCVAAMVNFVDASQVADLQALDVVELLGEHCSWEEEEVIDQTSAKLVAELAVYSLSKLCTRDFVPKGDRVVATITTMMDFEPQTIEYLDSVVRTRVTPELPHPGAWNFLQPNRDLGTIVAPGLRGPPHPERPVGVPMNDWRGEAGLVPGGEGGGGAGKGAGSRAGIGAGAGGGVEIGAGIGTGIGTGTGVAAGEGASRFCGGAVRWEIRLALRGSEVHKPHDCIRAAPTDRSKAPTSRTHGFAKGHGHGGGGGRGPLTTGTEGGTSTAPTTSTGAGVGEAKEEGAKGSGAKVKGGGGELPQQSLAESTASADGVAGGGVLKNATHKLKATAARLTSFLSETSMAVSAFGSVAAGPVNLQTRILKNPILTEEDPPFQLPWLLNHGKADRLRLFHDSLGSVPPVCSWQLKSKSSHQQGKSSQTHQAGARCSEQRMVAEGEDPDNLGFYVLTVPDDKWISPDLPPEAGKRPDSMSAGISGGSGGVGGGVGVRPIGARTHLSRSNTVAVDPSQQQRPQQLQQQGTAVGRRL